MFKVPKLSGDPAQDIELLYNSVLKLTRTLNDMLENLDDNNFSTQMRAEKEGMKSEIIVNADNITSTVTATLGKDVQPYYNASAPFLPGGDANKAKIYYNSYNQKYYEWNGTTWAETEAPAGSMQSQIRQTAKDITMRVSKTANYSTAHRGNEPPFDTELLWYDTSAYGYDGDGIYKYFNTITERWEPVDGGSIYSVFEQTASGFNLKGNVKIDGALIVGTIDANNISTEIAQVNSLLQLGNPNDTDIKRVKFNNTANIHNYVDGYGVYQNGQMVPTGIEISASTLKLLGVEYLKGTWNFSTADITLPDGAVTAKFA